MTQVSPLGQQGAGKKVGAGMASSPSLQDHAPNPPPSPQEPLEFTINHGQYVTPHPNLSPAAPGEFGVTLGG